MPIILETPPSTTLTLQPNIEHLENVRSLFMNFLTDLTIPENERLPWKLAFTEALSNAILHGNPQGTANTIDIIWTVINREVRLTIQDCGPGPQSHFTELPTLPENPYALSGRGLFLIYKFADAWEHAKTKQGYRQTISKFHSWL